MWDYGRKKWIMILNYNKHLYHGGSISEYFGYTISWFATLIFDQFEATFIISD